MAIKGIDISKWQTITSYDLLNNNPEIRFLYHKATQGVDLKDSKYQINMPHFTMPKTAYHYYRPKHDPIAQADFFYEIATSNGITLQGPPIFDIEGYFVEDKTYYLSTPKATVWNNILKCLARMHDKFGKKPLIYTGKYFWQDYIGWQSQIEQLYELIIANYGVLKPNLPLDWTNYRIWQYTDRGTAPGITGSVDWNIFNGTEQDFAVYFGGGVTPPPPPGGIIIVDTIQLDVLVTALNIRNKPNTTGGVTGSLTIGDHPCEFEEILNSDGSKWSRIGWKQYACKKGGSGTLYMQYSQV